MGAGIGVHLVRLVFRDGAQSAGLTDRRDAHHLPGRAARHWFFFFFFFKKKEDTNITDVVEELGALFGTQSQASSSAPLCEAVFNYS